MWTEDPSDKALRTIGYAALALALVWVAGYIFRHASNKADEHALQAALAEISEAEAQRRRAESAARAAIEAQERQRRAELAAQHQDQARAAAQQRARRAAKEAAWKNYYKAPPECENPGDNWQRQVDCANHYMRARAEWEKTYKD